MKKKRVIYSLCLGLASLLICTGVVYAASHDITSFLGGTNGDFFDVKGTMLFDSIKVGRQGTGGVTFFNGTIINSTTGTGGADLPVTFGDNVRIDGRVYRGATAGTSDSQPFIVNDNMQVVGSLTVGSLSGSGIVSSDNLADDSVTTAKIKNGTIAAADLANGAVTSTKITNGTIATADLSDSVVTSAKITDGTVTNADIADSAAISTAKINGLDNSLTSLNNNKANVDHNHDSSYVSKGNPEWDTRTGYITIPAAAFTPELASYTYTNSGNILYAATGGGSIFVAPVFLPHGATVTRLDFYYKDNSANDLTLYLNVTARTDSGTSMASITSSGQSSQYTSSSTTTINVSTVDNLSYNYYLSLSFPGNDSSNLIYSGALIRYSYSEPY